MHFHIPPAFTRAQGPPLPTPSMDGVFVASEESALIHPNRPEFIAHAVGRRRYCTLYMFGQMFADCTHHDSTRRGSVTVLQDPASSLYPAPPLAPGSHRSLHCLHHPAFSRKRHSWNHAAVAFPDWRLWLCNMHLSFPCAFSWLPSSFLFSAA